jgi:hypothetical protein
MDLQKLGLLMSGIASTTSRDPRYLQTNLQMQDSFSEMKERERMEAEREKQDLLLRRLSNPTSMDMIGTPATKQFEVNGRMVGQNAPGTMAAVMPDDMRLRSLTRAFPRESLVAELQKRFAPETVTVSKPGDIGRRADGSIAFQNPAAPDQSDIEKRAVAAGLIPGTPQFQEFIKTATLRPNSVTNVNMPDAKGDVKYMEKMGEILAQDFAGLQSAGTAAQTSLAKFDRLGGLLEGVNTGAFKGTTTQMKAIAKSAGVDLDSLGITDDVAPAQAAKAITNEIALQLRNPAGGAGMPGALSDKDREFLLQMVPSLETTPEGNKTLVDYWRRLNKRTIDVAKMSRDYMKKNGGRFDYGFYDELADYSEKNSLFPESDRAAAPAQGATPAAGRADYEYVPGRGLVRSN